MKLKIANTQRSVIAKLGIGCIVCLLVGFGALLYAQDKAKTGFIAVKPGMNTIEKLEAASAKMQEIVKVKEQAETQRNRFRQRQNQIDFGENPAFYKVIVDNNIFRPLGWTPPNNEPAYSLVGTAVGAEGSIAQATLLEKRSNRYHFVTIGEKLGSITVKDIQAKQVVLEKDGKPITLKTETLHFLTTKRDGGSKAGGGGGSEKGGSNHVARNQANAKQQQMEVEKRRQMEMQKQAGALGINQKELGEKLKNASPEERQEIMREIRRRAARERRGGDRRRSDR